ncbi:TPA: hypothetical protein U2M17_001475 [Providencia stuartii]|nr:hypothetical protein [Providencia stuartii]
MTGNGDYRPGRRGDRLRLSYGENTEETGAESGGAVPGGAAGSVSGAGDDGKRGEAVTAGADGAIRMQ